MTPGRDRDATDFFVSRLQDSSASDCWLLQVRSTTRFAKFLSSHYVSVSMRARFETVIDQAIVLLYALLMRIVVDSNRMQSDELRGFLSLSSDNIAVLTDYAAMEAFQGDMNRPGIAGGPNS